MISGSDLGIQMGKLVRVGKVLDWLRVSVSSCPNSSCFCVNMENDKEEEEEQDLEKRALVTTQAMRLKDVVSGNQTLAFHLKPKKVELKVSMHCNGCARKVEKHVSKLQGVTSYKVDLASKTVIVIGDIIPYQVLESVSKLKFAQLSNSSSL